MLSRLWRNKLGDGAGSRESLLDGQPGGVGRGGDERMSGGVRHGRMQHRVADDIHQHHACRADRTERCQDLQLITPHSDSCGCSTSM